MNDLRTNADRLVKISVMGEVDHPTVGHTPYRITPDGELRILVGGSGIVYNVRVGDPATGWEADHLEPCVSIRNNSGDRMTGANGGLNALSCVGNQATVVSGKAEGATGVVTGQHGGAERIMVDFTPDILTRMLPGDKVLVTASGVGLKLLDYPDVSLFNLDPEFLHRMNIRQENGRLLVPVAHRAPSAIMGSGLGRDNVQRGDYDITLFDQEIVRQYGLDDLRLGDIVAILDADNSYGRIYRQGAVSIGIIAHGDSVVAGHGPGVTTLMTCPRSTIVPVDDPGANIADLLGLR